MSNDTGFTLENTADATHMFSVTQFQKVHDGKCCYMNANTGFGWLYCSNQAFVQGDYIELSRPIGERKEDFEDDERMNHVILNGPTGCHYDEIIVHNEQEVAGDTSHLNIDLEQPKPYARQKSVLMEESLMCIIDHLSEFEVCNVGTSGFHATSIDELHSPQQKAKWVAMNALGLLNIDSRTDEEKLSDQIYTLWDESCDKWTMINNLMEAIKTNNLAGVKWAGE